MASGSSQNSKPSSQSTASGPSSSPPIPIPPKKTDLKSSIPTPLASHETEPKTPDLRQRPVEHTFGHQLPPTPGDAPPEKPERMPSPSFVFDRAEAILESLKPSSNTRERLKPLTEETFARLRAAIDFDTPLPFEVEPEAFEEWSQNLTDLGGYEYDSTRKELKILTLPGVIHERVTQVFGKWFGKVQETFQQEDRMHFTHNEDYTLENGSNITPDGYISVETGGPVVAIEVGVSQPFDKQVEKAEKWLLKGPARLVILVDVGVITLRKGEFSSSFTSSTSSTLESQEALPYGITKQDLESLKVKEIASKIYNWHNDKTGLAKLMHVNLYLYRHKLGNPKAINQDAKFVIFEESSGIKNWGSSEGLITTNDLDIPTGNKKEKVALPFDLLQACFGPALKKEQIRVAEKKAREILILHGHERDNSSFQPSSGAGEVHSRLQDAGPHGDILERPQTRRERKRKLSSSAVDVGSDLDSSFGPAQSFQTTSSGVFQMDPPVPSDTPQFSQRSSPIPPVDSQVPKASLAGFSSALDIAASQGDEEIARMLVERGANVEVRYYQRDTLILLAARNGHGEVVKYLLEKGAVVEARDSKGSTALLLAARHDSIPLLRIFLDKVADIRACDNQGRSVLHRALEWLDVFSVVPKQEAIVRMLLKHGADPTMRNNNGKTPKQAAFH